MLQNQILPFKRAIKAHRVLDKTLEDWQKEAFEGINVALDEIEPNLFVTPGLWAGMKRKMPRGTNPYLIELKDKTSAFHPFEPATAKFLLKPVKKIRADAEPMALDFELMDVLQFTVKPYGPPPHHLILPVFRQWGMHLEHWVQLLDANLMALHWEKHHLQTRGGNYLGNKVKIHPTAMVCGSVLEDGVEIEPFASVMNCHIGQEAKVAAHTILNQCVLGAGSQTLVDSHFRRVVVGQNSTVANLGLFDSVIGDNTFVTTAVSSFGHAIGLSPQIEKKNLYRPVIGICIGDGATVGARALFHSGMALPDGILVVGRPDEVASKVDLAGLYRAQMQIGDPLEHV